MTARASPLATDAAAASCRRAFGTGPEKTILQILEESKVDKAEVLMRDRSTGEFTDALGRKIDMDARIAAENKSLQARDMQKSDPDGAMALFHEALKDHENLGRYSLVVETYHDLGNLCERRQDCAAAKEYYFKAMTTILQEFVYDLGEPYDLAATYESLGYMSYNLDQWDEAEDYFKQYIKQQADNQYGVKNCVIDPTADLPKDLHDALLADVHTKDPNRYKNLIQMFGDNIPKSLHDAIHAEGPSNRNYRFMSIILMLGKVAAKNGDYASAKGYMLKRISVEYELCAHRLEDVSLNLASLHYDFGKIALELGHPADALEHLEKTLEYEISKHGPDNVDVAITHNILGDAAKAMGDFATARGHYERTLAIREVHGGVGTGGLRGDDRDVLLAKVAECAEALAPPPDFDAEAEIANTSSDGAAVDQDRGDDATSLFIACQNGHVDAARLLLDKGAEVDRATEHCMTPLFIACVKGHVDVARLLLDKGAEVDQAIKDGVTPLWVACMNGHVAVARLLLDKGAAVDQAEEKGMTPLIVACQQGHVDAARLLLEKGAAVDRAPEDGGTPLDVACIEGHVNVARLLLEKGADVNRARENGATPLFIACLNGRVDAAQLLLDKGAEVDRATENGSTPLFSACFKGHVDVARLLLEKGAEVDRAREDGWTPLSSARSQGHSSIVALLEEHQK